MGFQKFTNFLKGHHHHPPDLGARHLQRDTLPILIYSACYLHKGILWPYRFIMRAPTQGIVKLSTACFNDLVKEDPS